MTIRKLTLTLSLLFTFLAADPIPSFVPPSGWRAQDPSHSSQSVKISFIAKRTHGFNPSINLAVESVSSPLNQYVEKVVKLHTMDKRSRCEKMGTFKTLSGEGALLKLERELPWGKVQLLQLLQITDGRAYILTAVAKKESFGTIQGEILKSFRSLELFNSFIASAGRKGYPLKNQIAATKKKIRLPTKATHAIVIPRLKKLEQFCQRELPEKGPYWHALLLQDISKEILYEKKIS